MLGEVKREESGWEKMRKKPEGKKLEESEREESSRRETEWRAVIRRYKGG